MSDFVSPSTAAFGVHGRSAALALEAALPRAAVQPPPLHSAVAPWLPSEALRLTAAEAGAVHRWPPLPVAAPLGQRHKKGPKAPPQPAVLHTSAMNSSSSGVGGDGGYVPEPGATVIFRLSEVSGEATTEAVQQLMTGPRRAFCFRAHTVDLSRCAWVETVPKAVLSAPACYVLRRLNLAGCLALTLPLPREIAAGLTSLEHLSLSCCDGLVGELCLGLPDNGCGLQTIELRHLRHVTGIRLGTATPSLPERPEDGPEEPETAPEYAVHHVGVLDIRDCPSLVYVDPVDCTVSARELRLDGTRQLLSMEAGSSVYFATNCERCTGADGRPPTGMLRAFEVSVMRIPGDATVRLLAQLRMTNPGVLVIASTDRRADTTADSDDDARPVPPPSVPDTARAAADPFIFYERQHRVDRRAGCCPAPPMYPLEAGPRPATTRGRPTSRPRREARRTRSNSAKRPSHAAGGHRGSGAQQGSAPAQSSNAGRSPLLGGAVPPPTYTDTVAAHHHHHHQYQQQHFDAQAPPPMQHPPQSPHSQQQHPAQPQQHPVQPQQPQQPPPQPQPQPRPTALSGHRMSGSSGPGTPLPGGGWASDPSCEGSYPAPPTYAVPSSPNCHDPYGGHARLSHSSSSLVTVAADADQAKGWRPQPTGPPSREMFGSQSS